MRKKCKYLVWVIVAISAVCALFYVCDVGANFTCSQQTNGLPYEHRFQPFAGCQICINGSWILLDMMKRLQRGEIRHQAAGPVLLRYRDMLNEDLKSEQTKIKKLNIKSRPRTKL